MKVKPEEKSDMLDIDIANFVRKDARRRLWVNIFLVFIVVLVIGQYFFLIRQASENRRYSEENNAILTSRLEERDETIKDQESVINQAVEIIIRLANQVKGLGGDPGQITLKPE